MKNRISRPSYIVFLVLALAVTSSDARSWRPGQLPNGTRFNCSNCHFNSGGGGSRNGFGNAVNGLVGRGSRTEFWNAELAALDSDGDGFTNGEELGDPDGDGVAPRGATVTNPGDPASRPAPRNSAPVIASTAVTQAEFGVEYRYQVEASDPEGAALSYSLAGAPGWLSISPGAGLIQGIPPEDAVGVFSVTVQVEDAGDPPETAEHKFELNVAPSFEGWRNLRFGPASADVEADSDADPDGDGRSNFAEYLLRSDPRSPDSEPIAKIAVGPSGRMRVDLRIRDDDPRLSVQIETAFDIGFSSRSALTVQVSDPDVGDGFKTVTFRDTDEGAGAPARFARISAFRSP